MASNEYPWHLPEASNRHHRWYRDIVDFHDLTLAWLDEFQIKRDPHLLSRSQLQSVDDLRLLESLASRPLESLLNDTSPEELLTHLNHRVWATQAHTLGSLLDRVNSATERESALAVLGQCSWKKGRAMAEARWSGLPDADRKDLLVLLKALADTPFGTQEVLIRRSLPQQLDFELRACPHQINFVEVVSQADVLCALHSQWIRGFVYALNHRVGVEDQVTTPRCIHRWTILAS